MKSVAVLSILCYLSAVSGQTTGRWSLLTNNHVVCIHQYALPDGRIFCNERPHVTPYSPNPFLAQNGFVATEYQTKNGRIESTDAVYNPFCAGHAQMASGNILVVGGDFPPNRNAAGTQVLSDGRLALREYVPCADGAPATCVGTWVQRANLGVQRWYPTVVTTYLGNNIIISGSLKNLDLNNLADSNNPTYEYYPAKPNGTITWPRFMPILNDAFPYNLYPISFQLPSGQILLFCSNSTNLIDPATDVIDTTSILPIVLPDKQPWIYPFTPTGFMLPLTVANNFVAKIMVCGGTKVTGLAADNRCISLNTGDANPQWSLQGTMPTARTMPDAVILPDGKVLLVNGVNYGVAGGAGGESYNANQPVYTADMYDPVADTWTPMAKYSVPRLYHSTAILLADGRVSVGGSEEQNYVDWDAQKKNCYPFANQGPCTSPFEHRMEVFEPPYLFLAVERPVISQAPATSAYNTAFTINTSTDGTQVDKVALVRYSTATHSTNTDQRYVELVIASKSATALQVTSPLNSKIAPPGNYHLFILRGGKPSIATTLRLTL